MEICETNVLYMWKTIEFIAWRKKNQETLPSHVRTNENMVEEVEVGEHLGASDHNIVCANTLLRVRVQDSRERLLDFQEGKLRG